MNNNARALALVEALFPGHVGFFEATATQFLDIGESQIVGGNPAPIGMSINVTGFTRVEEEITALALMCTPVIYGALDIIGGDFPRIGEVIEARHSTLEIVTLHGPACISAKEAALAITSAEHEYGSLIELTLVDAQFVSKNFASNVIERLAEVTSEGFVPILEMKDSGSIGLATNTRKHPVNLEPLLDAIYDRRLHIDQLLLPGVVVENPSEVFVKIAAILANKHCQLCELYLPSDPDNHVYAIVIAMAVNTSVKVLHVDTKSEDVQTFYKVVTDNKTLEHLDFGPCWTIRSEFFEPVVHALNYNTTLNYLGLPQSAASYSILHHIADVGKRNLALNVFAIENANVVDLTYAGTPPRKLSALKTRRLLMEFAQCPGLTVCTPRNYMHRDTLVRGVRWGATRSTLGIGVGVSDEPVDVITSRYTDPEDNFIVDVFCDGKRIPVTVNAEVTMAQFFKHVVYSSGITAGLNSAQLIDPTTRNAVFTLTSSPARALMSMRSIVGAGASMILTNTPPAATVMWAWEQLVLEHTSQNAECGRKRKCDDNYCTLAALPREIAEAIAKMSMML